MIKDVIFHLLQRTTSISSDEGVAHMGVGFMAGLAFALTDIKRAEEIHKQLRMEWGLDINNPPEYGPGEMAKILLRGLSTGGKNDVGM